MSSATIDRRIKDGLWHRLYLGVYSLAGSPTTWRQQLVASCLALGTGAVISHRAAAALWSFMGFEPGPVELSVPRGRRRVTRLEIHFPLSLQPTHVTKVDGIPVTTPTRTLVDIAGSLHGDVLEEVLDDALRRRLVTLRALQRTLMEIGSRGREGVGTLARLVRARTDLTAVPESVFETRLLRTVRKAGLPAPTIQHPIQTANGFARIDFAYVERKVAIEADGFRWHSTRRQWDHDRARQAALIRMGWTVFHVTWQQLLDRPDEVIETIRDLLYGP